jgi:hypothetical protein
VKGVVLDMLGGIRVNLAQELRGIDLEVMQALMGFEISSIAAPLGKHQESRRYSPDESGGPQPRFGYR